MNFSTTFNVFLKIRISFLQFKLKFAIANKKIVFLTIIFQNFKCISKTRITTKSFNELFFLKDFLSKSKNIWFLFFDVTWISFFFFQKKCVRLKIVYKIIFKHNNDRFVSTTFRRFQFMFTFISRLRLFLHLRFSSKILWICLSIEFVVNF